VVRISNSRSKNGKTLRKRLEILRGAAGAFRRDGFERAGMREIARAVEMSPAGLYHYFRTKHEILYFCQDYSLDRMLEAAGRVRRRREPADVKLRRLIMAQMTCMLDELQGTAAHAEFSSLPARLLGKVVRKRDRYERLMRGVIEGGVRAKIFRPCDPKLVTLAILGAINWTIKWYRPDGARGANEIAGEFADYLVRGLKR
jgi:AcrR family transcriptional regulator